MFFKHERCSCGEATANVQIPFTLIILIVSVSAGFVIPKFGNAQLGLIGSMINSAGFFGLFMLHSSELLISANLAIIAVGITLTRVGIWNVTLEYAPREYTGISLGMTALLFFVGMSIGPAIAGVYMQSHQVLIRDSNIGNSSTSSYYPSSQSYNLIFLTAFSISIASVAIVAVLKRRLSGVELLQNR